MSDEQQTSARHGGNEVRIPAPDGDFDGYLALPGGGHGPGVVVIQEWWGLVDAVRDDCDRLARAGFVALAPDLYRGEATLDPDVASRLMMDLEIPRAERDLEAAVTELLRHESVDGARVGCIGFCMGGQLALDAATRDPRIAAVVDCYGIHPNVKPDLRGLQAAVLGIFAENDEFIPQQAVRALEADLAAAGKRAHIEIVPGVQHAFLNDRRPEVYDPAAAARTWDRIATFLRAELSNAGSA